MNPRLQSLQPYPFERLRQLFAGVTPNPALAHISLGIGEPRHPTPDFIKRALTESEQAELAWLNGVMKNEKNVVIVISHDEDQRLDYIKQGLLGDGLQ